MGEISNQLANRTVVEAGSIEPVSFESDDGAMVSLTADMVRQKICKNASDVEIAMFLATCKKQRLDPFNKDIYLVKYGNNPAQMNVAHKILLRRAVTNPKFDGIRTGVTVYVDGKVVRDERRAYYPEVGEQLLGGWCEIYRKDVSHPFKSELSLKEMSKGQSLWKTMPAVMITKCAQASCIRDAFPDEVGWLYSDAEKFSQVDSEVEEPREPRPQQSAIAAAVAPQTDKSADMEELRELTDRCVGAGFDRKETKRWIWDAYKKGGVEAARTAAEGLLAQAVTDVNPDTGELYEQDIEF